MGVAAGGVSGRQKIQTSRSRPTCPLRRPGQPGRAARPLAGGPSAGWTALDVSKLSTEDRVNLAVYRNQIDTMVASQAYRDYETAV